MQQLIRRLLPLFLLLAALTPNTPAAAENLDPCRVEASPNQDLSLGFPVRGERLSSTQKSKILVVPFKLKDNPNYLFTDAFKSNYLTAASNVSILSNGLSNIEFVFASTISTELTNADMEQLKINQQQQWQKDESKSTYGFVRKFLADHDSRLDFTGINGVILEGSSTSLSSDINEAFTFRENPQSQWFRPIQTDEGAIYNVVLFDNDTSERTITHEIMHMYGLTDLYGTNTGPGRLSLMASNGLNLLSYEKWVLGWLPDSQVQCLYSLDPNKIYKIPFNDFKVNQLAVIRPSDDETYIVETSGLNGRRYIAFYSLDNEARPPIKLFQDRTQFQSGGIEIADYRAIGTQLKSPNYTLLVSGLDSSSTTLHLVPTSLTSSVEFKELVINSGELKSRIELEIQAESVAATELRAKQEAEKLAAAEAKATAELKAKQDAAAKLAAQKKKTIICVKGKSVKKVTAIKPKCPVGFKKR